jgi:hypothetical protein
MLLFCGRESIWLNRASFPTSTARRSDLAGGERQSRRLSHFLRECVSCEYVSYLRLASVAAGVRVSGPPMPDVVSLVDAWRTSNLLCTRSVPALAARAYGRRLARLSALLLLPPLRQALRPRNNTIARSHLLRQKRRAAGAGLARPRAGARATLNFPARSSGGPPSLHVTPGQLHEAASPVSSKAVSQCGQPRPTDAV